MIVALGCVLMSITWYFGSQIALRTEQLKELNPARYEAFQREQGLLNKALNMAGNMDRGGGQRLATRRGFDVGLATLDNYRGRDPNRAFGSTKAEHELMLSVTSTPVSERRRAEILRDLPIRSTTSVELLHSLHAFNADTDHLLRHRASVDPLLQPGQHEMDGHKLLMRDRAHLSTSYTPYSRRHFTVG